MVAKRICFFFLFFSLAINAQVSVGSGSYSTTFPGADSAGRNGYPSGTPYVSGVAANQPIPTNDWWSKLVKQGSADNLFNYPFTMKTLDTGLIVSYIPWGVIGDSAPIEVGLTGLDTNKVTVSDHTDWTVTMDWTSGDKNLSVTSGVGMPFLYFEKSDQEEVAIKINSGNATVSSNQLIIENASHGADFVVFAPSGSTWRKNGSVYTSNLNGKNYWSLSMLPQNTTNLQASIDEMEPYAFVFPIDTQVSWSYNESNSKLSSTYTITSEVKEGTNTQFYQGLLPHHWAHLSSNSDTPDGPSYSTVRGEMKILKGNVFSLEHYFTGILPTLPNLVQYSDSFDIGELVSKVQDLENSGLDLWTDSYNEGQLMNRLVQTARIAHEIGLPDARDKLLATVKERLEDWLTYTSGEVAFMFYYQPQWTTLIGYPAGHQQDSNINDHHFHWGYFIHAASFVEQFEPGWLSQWGGMIDLLVRDAATADRDDAMFPFLRNFSPFAGHSWANGFASFPQGNDQESTSESMQFNSSLIHYGSISGNKEIRDLGIFLYMTEKTAIDEYWFDMNERNFSSSQNYSLVSRVWGNSYDNGTFWTADITASYGIEMYPIHGGSYYLASNQNYVNKLWSEIESNTDILNSNSTNPNLWYDTFWKYLSMSNPQKALELYELSPNRILKFGISDAQTYYWLHSANAIGRVRPDITANHPIAMAFENDSKLTYIAHNYDSSPITVTFSDGYELLASPNQMTTSVDVDVTGELVTDFTGAYANSSVNLELVTENQNISKVEFYSGGEFLFADDASPYEYKTDELSLGRHNYYARIYVGSQYEISNPLEIRVGEQTPYQGEINQIPGIIQAGNYDEFEGGIGQSISYLDLSKGNNGDYRTDEYVDSSLDTNEGAIVGFINSGEWLEYTVDVQQSGYYNLNFRYASGNANGGGPFRILLDGKEISNPINISSTSTTNWSTFRTTQVTNLPFVEGDHILRLEFDYGEFNLGKMEFSFDRGLDYEYIVADAGQNRSIILPEASAVLDGSNTVATGTVNYQWSQIYGPSVVSFENENLITTTVNNLEKGVYKFKLEVSSSSTSDYDEVILAVNETGNQPPAITFVSPSNQSTFKEGESILLKTRVSDLDGSVDQVNFYENGNLIKEIAEAPFKMNWTPTENGDYTLTAVAVDDQDLETQSDPINITVETVKQCVSSGSNAQQGSFSIGYKTTFETVGTSVTVTFELLDTDKSGVIAYLWQESPFQEFELEQVADRVFSRTISGLTKGQEISYAAKFAFAGGLSVTPYEKYVVGSDCSSNEQDTAPPTNFSASISSINSTSVSFDLYAEDNSGELIYTIFQNGGEQSFAGQSATSTTVTYTGLSPETNYTFTLSVSDKNGNVSSTQKTLEATTIESSNNSCSGESNVAQQGSFTLGYKYSFKTEGSQVIIEFELLDDYPDLIAYLWKKDPFSESSMSSVGPRTFRAVLTNQSIGSTISYAVKFAFAGGLAVTKYFDYVVGDNCVVIDDEDNDGVEDTLDQCPGTPAGAVVNTKGCEVFSLPATTFTVSVTSATCPDSSNGSIMISSSNMGYSYRYAINDQAPVALTDNTQIISNLSAGIYTVCVTVDGVADYQRCYTIEITEPAPLVASSRIDMSSRNMQLDLSGSEEYQITINGKTFLTTEDRLSLNLEPGMNRVEVATTLDCQGVYFEEIFVSETVKIYPNPTPGPLQLFVAGSDTKVELSITSLSGGVLRKETIAVPANRIIETSLGNLPEGLYLLTLNGRTVKTTHKVIKE